MRSYSTQAHVQVGLSQRRLLRCVQKVRVPKPLGSDSPLVGHVCPNKDRRVRCSRDVLSEAATPPKQREGLGHQRSGAGRATGSAFWMQTSTRSNEPTYWHLTPPLDDFCTLPWVPAVAGGFPGVWKATRAMNGDYNSTPLREAPPSPYAAPAVADGTLHLPTYESG